MSTSCSSCGSGIDDSDFETGAAIALLGKNYCSGCKGKAANEISLDELGSAPLPRPSDPTKAFSPPPKAPPSARPAPSPRPSPSPKPAAKAPPTSRSAGARRVTRRRATSNVPLYAGIGIGAALVAVVAAILLMGGGDPDGDGGAKPPSNPDATGKTPRTGTAPAPPGDPDALAREAFLRAQTLSRNSNVDFDSVLAEIRKAAPLCKGTEWEKKLRDLETQMSRQKAATEATKELGTRLDALEKAVAADEKFLRYAEIMEQFREARELTAKAGGKQQDRVRKMQADYNNRYEREAQAFFEQIHPAAQALARENRDEDALKYIETFPAHLRQSGAWRQLDRLRQSLKK